MNRTIDVHSHYLPEDALDLMANGRAVVSTRTDHGVSGCIAVNEIRVGTTVGQIGSVDSILRAMDASGVGRRVLSPPPFTYRYWSDLADTLALHRRLNEATAAVVDLRPDRFSGLCTVPMQSPGTAIDEYTRATQELGLVGLTVGTNVDGRNLSDDGQRDVLAAAADSGLPVLVHPDFVPNPRLSEYYLLNLVGMPTESAITLANLIMTGTLEKLPGLRICFVHGGGSLPYLLGRLDKGWSARAELRTDTTKPPSESIGNVYFDTLTHSPLALRYLIDAVGAENVVIGTDAPFDVEEPQPLTRLRECPGLTEEEEIAIVEHSPRRWLGGDPQ